MEINKETYQLFQEYLDQTLSIEKQQELSQRLINDDEFKNIFEQFKVERTFVIQKELMESKKMLEQFHSEYQSKPSKLYYWFIGLVGLGLLNLTLFFVFPIEQINTSKNTQLISQHKIQKKDYQKKKHLIKDDTNTIIVDSLIIQHEEKKKNESVEIDTIKISKPINILEKEKNAVGPDTTLLKTPKEIIKSNSSHKIVSKEIKCDEKNWDVQVLIKPTCKGDNNGEIEVVTTNQNLTLFFNNQERKEDFVFKNLTYGSYDIQCIDENGCEYIKDIYLSEKECLNLDVIIDLGLNELWEIPFDAKLIIMNSNGSVIFDNYMNKGEEYQGIDKYGNPLKTGIYFFKLHSNDVKRGTITIP